MSKKKLKKIPYKILKPKVSNRSRKEKLLSTLVNPVKIKPKMSVGDLVDSMSQMSIQARNVGTCAKVVEKMMTDKDRPTVLLGLAGPLIAAGLRSVIRDLIVGGYVDVVVSTGAIVYQDIYQARGFKHYKGTPHADDVVLRNLAIDRIYDTYIDEEKVWGTDIWIGKITSELSGTYSSRQFMDFLGSKLDDEDSIVYQCHKHGIPIFCPALNDSSIGIGLTEHRHRSIIRKDHDRVVIDSIQDNYELTQIVVASQKTSAIYVAGGVPKNYINDSIVMGYIFGLERGHHYAVQMTTAVTADGGLSSSTLGEAQSWGKIRGDADFCMAWVEPSVSLPLVAGYIFDRFPKGRKKLNYKWNGDMLEKLTIKQK